MGEEFHGGRQRPAANGLGVPRGGGRNPLVIRVAVWQRVGTGHEPPRHGTMETTPEKWNRNQWT